MLTQVRKINDLCRHVRWPGTKRSLWLDFFNTLLGLRSEHLVFPGSPKMRRAQFVLGWETTLRRKLCEFLHTQLYPPKATGSAEACPERAVPPCLRHA
jgi:hypothetical protein